MVARLTGRAPIASCRRRNSTSLTRHLAGGILVALAAAAFLAEAGPAQAAEGQPIKVLLATGDWKSQAFYQDEILPLYYKKDPSEPTRIYRGRFIAQKVNEAAPGQFEFTQIPNYIAQEYIDADYLSHFDVVLLGDIMAHLPVKFQTGLRDFVKNGGGVIYCANHKWGTGIFKLAGTPFEEALPTTYPPVDEKGSAKGYLDNRNFKPAVADPNHPVTKGLDWQSCPPLHNVANMPAKTGATVLLQTPGVEARPWNVLGPFPNPKDEGFNTVYEPEKGVDLARAYTIAGIKEPVHWKRAATNAVGQVGLVPLFTPNEYVCAYAVTYVKSPDARNILCVGAGDDGMKAWVNGAAVAGDETKKGAWPGKAPANLKAGWNEILLKITQLSGGWGFTFDLLRPDGQAMPDLVYSSRPADTPKEYVESAPVLTAWPFGKGRAIFSASIFANDGPDETGASVGEIGNWKDFGKFYAQVFAWLGENSKSQKAALKNTAAEVTATVDFTKPLNTFSAGVFSIHGNEGITGLALENYMALNPKGAISRGSEGASIEANENDNDDPNVFNWEKIDFKSVDVYLAGCKQYGTEPIACFHGLTYGGPKWLWPAGRWFGNANEEEAAEVAEMVAAYLEHANKGRKGSPTYEPIVKYVDIGNEPELNYSCISGYMKIVKAVGQRVHRDYPGVLVGAYCPYSLPYVKQFIDEVGDDFDWFSFHPYGWTAEEFFEWVDEIQAYARQKGRNNIKIMITEWDFWIHGREKFDYMMRRYFTAVKRDDLLGTIHYRFWEYMEPIYRFGVVYSYNKEDWGNPMHDSYDAFWIWKDFRGQRVETAKTLDPPDATPKLLDHLHLDASRSGDKLSAVLYYDWAYDGTGFKDYAKGLQYTAVKVDLKMVLPPSDKERTVTIRKATGEGFEVLKRDGRVPAGAKDHTETLQVAPMTALAVTVE